MKKGYATRRGKIAVEDAAAYVRDLAQRLEARGRLGATRSFIQHGDVSVYDHVLAVAKTSICMARVLSRVGIAVDVHALVRGALLHDYFLYDWHQPHKEYGLHGFTHPSTALRNAVQDFDLNAVERNIIARHMFPLVPIPPRYRESVIVCLADKFCSLNETFSRQRYLTLVRLLSAALIFQR